MRNLIDRIDFAIITTTIRALFESVGQGNVAPPPLERRSDLSDEEIEQVWIDWIHKQNLPETAIAQWADSILSYVRFKSIPQGMGPAPKPKTAAPAVKPRTAVPVKERPDSYVPTGPMTINKYGKQVPVDAGIGRPPPNMGYKS